MDVQSTVSPARNSHNYCSAYGCKSYGQKNFNLSFHKVPLAGRTMIEVLNKSNQIEKIDIRSVWMRRLKINEKIKHPTVCSSHFEEEDFYKLCK